MISLYYNDNQLNIYAMSHNKLNQFYQNYKFFILLINQTMQIYDPVPIYSQTPIFKLHQSNRFVAHKSTQLHPIQNIKRDTLTKSTKFRSTLVLTRYKQQKPDLYMNTIMGPLREKYQLNEKKITQLQRLWAQYNIPAFYYYYFIQLLKKKSTAQKHDLIVREIQIIQEKKNCYYLEALDFIKARQNILSIIISYFHNKFTRENIQSELNNYQFFIKNQSELFVLQQTSSKVRRAYNSELFLMIKHINMYRMLTIKIINIINEWEKWLRYNGYTEPVQFVYLDEDYLFKIYERDSNQIAYSSGFFQKNPFFILKKEYEKGEIQILYNSLKPDVAQSKELSNVSNILDLHASLLVKYKLNGTIKSYRNRDNKVWPKRRITLNTNILRNFSQKKNYNQANPQQIESNNKQYLTNLPENSPPKSQMMNRINMAIKKSQSYLPKAHMDQGLIKHNQSRVKIAEQKIQHQDKIINFEIVQIQQNQVLEFLQQIFVRNKYKSSSKIDYYLRTILAQKQCIILKMTKGQKLLGLVIGTEDRLPNHRDYFQIVQFIKFGNIEYDEVIKYLSTYNKYFYIKTNKEQFYEIPIEPVNNNLKDHIKIKIMFQEQKSKQFQNELKKLFEENPNLKIVYKNRFKKPDYYDFLQKNIVFKLSFFFQNIKLLKLVTKKSEILPFFKIKIPQLVKLKCRQQIVGYKLSFPTIQQTIQIYQHSQNQDIIYQDIKIIQQEEIKKNVDLLLPVTSIKFQYETESNNRILFQEYIKINNVKMMKWSLIRHENKFNTNIIIKLPYILKIMSGNEPVYISKVHY